MGTGFKHGAGGSNPLNFKVICNPQPASAKENTIWVDTDKINNYYFSATQPENMAEYDLWFRTDTSSSVTFNALKKNGIQVYPLLVKQYVGGALVDKTAKSYQGGEWVDWKPAGALYYLGDECSSVTGGWFKTYHSQGSSGSFTKNANSITIKSATGNQASQCGCMTQNSINMTGNNNLKVNFTEFSGSSSNGSLVQVMVFSAKGAPINLSAIVLDAKVSNGSAPGVFTFDVSNISSGYVAILATSDGVSATFDKVWLD